MGFLCVNELQRGDKYISDSPINGCNVSFPSEVPTLGPQQGLVNLMADAKIEVESYRILTYQLTVAQVSVDPLLSHI